MDDLSLLERLIEEDFGYVTSGVWGRAEEHDSLVVNREKQIFYWNSKGLVGDVYTYLTQVRKWSFQDAKEYIKINGGKGNFILFVKDTQEVVTYPPIIKVFMENLKTENKDFFYSRTLTDETISRFELGYYNGFYTIPVYQGGLFRQIILRKDYPKKLIRKYYKNVGGLLFNSDILKFTDRVYFTESPISAMVLTQNGFPAVSQDDGSQGFQPEWFSYFIHQKEIFLLFDNDSAGVNGAIKIANILGTNRCKIYTFEDSEIKGYGADDYFIDGKSRDDLLKDILLKSKYAFEYPKERRIYVRR